MKTKNVLIFPAVLNKNVRNKNKTTNKQKRSKENKQQKQENNRKRPTVHEKNIF